MVNNSIIPAYFLSGYEARDMEPDLSPDVCAALLVTETGIVNSGALVESLEREIQEEDYLKSSGADKVGVGLAGRSFDRGEGVVVPGTRVVRIDPAEDGKGWALQLESNWEDGPGDIDAVRASVVVDAAGLNSAALINELLPEDERMNIYISKGELEGERRLTVGNYMSYKGPGVENVNKLIYPCPSVNLDSLGTHLVSPLPHVRTSCTWMAHVPERRAEKHGTHLKGHLSTADSRLSTWTATFASALTSRHSAVPKTQSATPTTGRTTLRLQQPTLRASARPRRPCSPVSIPAYCSPTMPASGPT